MEELGVLLGSFLLIMFILIVFFEMDSFDQEQIHEINNFLP